MSVVRVLLLTRQAAETLQRQQTAAAAQILVLPLQPSNPPTIYNLLSELKSQRCQLLPSAASVSEAYCFESFV